jgi:hypothetical protein
MENKVLIDNIEHVFPEKRFEFFRKHCEKKGYVKLKDLLDIDFNKYIKNKKTSFNAKAVRKICYDLLSTHTEELLYKYMSEIKEVHKYLPLSSVLYENKYNKLIDFLNNLNIKTVYDLSKIKPTDFSKIPGVGKKKIEEVRDVYFSLFNKEKLEKYMLVDYFKNGINKKFYGIDISLIFNKDAINCLKKNNIYKIEDILQVLDLNFDYNKFFKNCNNQEYFTKMLCSLSMEPMIFIQNRFYEIIESEGFKIYYENIVNNISLVDLGKKYNCSREYVRIEKENIKKEILILLDFHEEMLVRNRKDIENIILTKNTLLKYVKKEEFIEILKDVLKGEKNRFIRWIDKLGIFIYSKEPDKIEKKLFETVKDLDKILDIKEKRIEIESILSMYMFENIDKDIIETLLLGYGYEQNGKNEIFCHVKAKKSTIYSFIVKKYYPDGIEKKPVVLRKFRRIYSEITHLDVPEKDSTTWRAIKKNSKNIVSGGTNMLIHVDNFDLSDNIYYKAQELIKNKLMGNIESGMLHLGKKFIYEYLKEDLKKEKSNITNEDILYNVLKSLFSDQYKFEKNKITMKENKIWTDSEVLEIMVKESDELKKVESIKKATKWSYKKIQNVVNGSNKLIFWEDNRYIRYVKNENIFKKEKDFYAKLIESTFAFSVTKGYANRYMVYNYGKASLIKRGIPDSKSLYEVLKYLFSDSYNFERGIHIVKATAVEENVSFLTVFKYLFEDSIYMSELEIKAKLKHKYKLPESDVDSLFSKYKRYIIMVGFDRYCLKEDFEIEKEVIERFDEELEEMLKYKKIINLKDLPKSFFSSKHALIKKEKYETNIYVLYQIKKDYLSEKYKIIKTKESKPTAIVRESSPINTVEDLLKHSEDKKRMEIEKNKILN